MSSVFLFGSTDLTLIAADAILAADVEIKGICHVGRKFDISYAPESVRNVRYADVDQWCHDHGTLSVPFSTNQALAETLKADPADWGLAVGWYHMIPASVRQLFPRGCAGVHASLLPKLRGGAPLNWAILIGEKETGVSLFEMTDGVDDGDLLGQITIPIGPRTNVGELVNRAAEATKQLIRDCLRGILDGTINRQPQLGEPSYGLQRQPSDGIIDWQQDAATIDRLIRAVTHPYPGAFTTIDQRRLIIWTARPLADGPVVHGASGQVFILPETRQVCLVTGKGILEICEASWDDETDALPDLARMNQRRFTGNTPATPPKPLPRADPPRTPTTLEIG